MALAGIQNQPDRGAVEVLGRNGTRDANDDVGYLPEERGLYKKMTVHRLLLYYAGLKGMGAKEANPRIDELVPQIVSEIDPAASRNKRIERMPGKHVIHRFNDRRPEFYGDVVKKQASSD